MSKTLENIRNRFEKKRHVDLGFKISISREQKEALIFLKETGEATPSEIIQEALEKWNTKGVVATANSIKRELKEGLKQEKKNNKNNIETNEDN